jgi:hypothetical protein
MAVGGSTPREVADALLDECAEIFNAADAEDRELDPDERSIVESHLKRAKVAQKRIQSQPINDEINLLFGRLDGGPVGTDLTMPGGSGVGWGAVAKGLSGKQSAKVEVPTESLLTKADAPMRRKDVTPSADIEQGTAVSLGTFMTLGADRRFLYQYLNSTPVGNELSVNDFRQVGSRTVTGDVERELTATTEKATLDLEVSFVNSPLKQVAVVIDNVPNALLDALGPLQVFLSAEAQFQLGLSIDVHCLTALENAPHTFNAEGTGLITRIRNAIGDHRTEGYNPTLLAVNPTDGAALDLTAFDAGYQFNVAAYGSSSPLFSQNVVEVPRVVDPLLIDPLAVGTLALGQTSVEVDRSAGFTKNLSIVRLEASVLMVVRNGAGVYEIANQS